MKLDFKIISTILTIFLVGGLSWVVRWAWKTIRQKFLQDVELYKLKVDNIHMAATLRERGSVKDELYEAAVKAGRGEGFMQVVEYIVLLASQGNEGKYEEIREQIEKDFGLQQKEIERSLGQGKSMARELENMRVLRGDMQNELQTLKLMSQGIRKREFESRKDRSRSVDSTSDLRQNSIDTALTFRQKGVDSASEMHNQRRSDEDSREIAPVFKLMDTDSRYRLQASEDLSRIHILNKRSAEELEVVAAGKIRKGKPYRVAEAVYLIWCELPGCDHLKITKSPNARACSREHMNQLTLLDRQKMKHGS